MRVVALEEHFTVPALIRRIDPGAISRRGAQEWIIRRSHLDWTIVRPSVLTTGPRTGTYRVLVGRFHGSNHMPTKIGSLRCSCGMPG